MPIEVKTRVNWGKNGRDPTVVLDLLLTPRGSGNRNKAQRLAKVFRDHEELGPCITRIVTGASRVTVHLRAGLATMAAVERWYSKAKESKDVEGQIPLFA